MRVKPRRSPAGRSRVNRCVLRIQVPTILPRSLRIPIPRSTADTAKDFSSRRGLLKKVGQRRRILRFLHKENPASFDELTKKKKLNSYLIHFFLNFLWFRTSFNSIIFI